MQNMERKSVNKMIVEILHIKNERKKETTDNKHILVSILRGHSCSVAVFSYTASQVMNMVSTIEARALNLTMFHSATKAGHPALQMPS